MKASAIFFFLIPLIAFAQTEGRELKPSQIIPLNLSTAGAEESTRIRERFKDIAKKVNDGVDIESLSDEEQRIWKMADEMEIGYWDIFGNECSWYCGGSVSEVTASSTLSPQAGKTYTANNAHDLSYETAWVEGVPGYGVGQSLLYTFSPETPRITDIIVVNGYVKSERAYLENSRVKKLKVYLNDKPLAVLLLEDRRSKQSFKFDPIGHGNRIDFDVLKRQPVWELKFEILEVYKGIKYDDVVITEIFFDGIDVH